MVKRVFRGGVGVGSSVCCDTISLSYGGLVQSGLYLIAGNCDQSGSGGELVNTAGGSFSLDTNYTPASRSDYTLNLEDQGTNVLSPDENFYSVTDSRFCSLNECLCISVFNQVSGVPSEDDVLVAQGSWQP